jgi:hypothetical protein
MRPPTVSATVRQYSTPALRPNWPRFDTRGVGGEFCGPNVSGTILSGTSLPSAEGGADEWTRYLDNAFTLKTADGATISLEMAGPRRGKQDCLEEVGEVGRRGYMKAFNHTYVQSRVLSGKIYNQLEDGHFACCRGDGSH